MRERVTPLVVITPGEIALCFAAAIDRGDLERAEEWAEAGLRRNDPIEDDDDGDGDEGDRV
jgi:hypothetical protein